MQHWQDPRPLFPWSAEPPARVAAGPRIRPNICARMARFAVRNPLAILLCALFVLAASITLAALGPAIAPDAASDVEVSAATRKLRAVFPAAETVFVVRLQGGDPGETVKAADAMAARLAAETGVIADAIVPGRGAYYERFGVYYLDPAAIEQGAATLSQRRPMLDLLSAQPNLEGLIDLTGKAPSFDAEGVAALFNAVSATIGEQERAGTSKLDWSAVAGVSFTAASRQWAIVVVPRLGAASAARQLAADVAQRLQAGDPSLKVTLDRPGAARDGRASAGARPMAVACFLAFLFGSMLLYAGLGRMRDVALAMTVAAFAAAVAIASSSLLQANGMASVVAVLIPSLAAAVLSLQAFAYHERRASSRLSLIMLAAQQAGPASVTALAMAAAIWLSWWPTGVDALWRHAAAAISGLIAMLLAALLLLPSLESLSPRYAPSFEDDAIAGRSRQRPWHRYRPALTLVLLAISALGLVGIWASPPGRGDAASDEPVQIVADDAEAAAKLALQISALPTAQPPNWAGALLPTKADAKAQRLRSLQAMTFPAPFTKIPNAAPYKDELRRLEAALLALTEQSGISEPLRASALELRRGVALLLNATAYPDETGRDFERLAFGGLAGLASHVEALSRLAPPSLADLDPRLRALFISPDGLHRIEVRPKAGTSAATLIAAMRRLTPGIAGTAADRDAQAATLLRRWGVALLLGLATSTLICYGYLRSIRDLSAFIITQAALLGLAAALAAIFSIPLDLQAAGALTMASAVSAMAGFAALSRSRHAWADWRGSLLAPLAGVVILLPLAALVAGDIQAYAHAALVALASVVILHATLLPQLLAWFRRPLLQSARDKPLN
jgi:uncharacterized protein